MIVQRAAGVPLFVEELTRVVLEGDSSRVAADQFRQRFMIPYGPPRSSGPAKEVLQIAAVVGNEFSFELLHAVHPIPDEELQAALHLRLMQNRFTLAASPRKPPINSSTRRSATPPMKRCSEAGKRTVF